MAGRVGDLSLKPYKPRNLHNYIIVEELIDPDGKTFRITAPVDKGCSKSLKCTTCPLPECIEIEREQTTKYKYKTELGRA